MKKTVLLVIVLILIAAVIFFISSKVAPEKQGVESDGGEVPINLKSERVKAKVGRYPVAKELIDPDAYINIDSITISELVGKKVILFDFWTYSCINCQRTLPYLNAWYEKYKDDGLEIVGVHSPEFEFEKDLENVKKAVEKFNVKYPVALDNDMKTWRAYRNRYWPHKYLIDIDGFIVYDHIGEGAYEQTEKKIQELLEERMQVLQLEMDIETDTSTPEAFDVDFQKIGTSELYFGYKFQRPGQIGNEEGFVPGQIVSYSIPAETENNKFYLEGSWFNGMDSMELKDSEGKIQLTFTAKNVYLVTGSDKETTLIIKLDGERVNELTVRDNTLYEIVSLEKYEQHLLEIEVTGVGFKIYTFTFG